MDAMKVCSKCKRMLPLEEFYQDTKTKDGHRPWCKGCTKSYSAAYYQANYERLAASQRKYHEDLKNRQRRKKDNRSTKEKYAAWWPGYYQANKEMLCAKSRKWQASHKEECAARGAQYARNNPDKFAASHAKRRALKLACGAEPLPEYYERGLYEAQHGLCYYCGDNLAETGYHREHMTPLSRGGAHSLANLCLSCPSCNARKNIKTAEEFFAVLRRGGTRALEQRGCGQGTSIRTS